ncbi:MAG TPA: heparinase II/III family protein [Oligoflexus sp.]|uniref:heparinase II/III domain-containing protein n=1 Tax=Oligoflexus sp. TaxID=1971216 RepID=UPI002D35FC07|nr:heparinase II/III family protein [Oligoflexus sp.]HYX39004.1 heparinase II/III family protein [Oligoflexus sp.]
MKILLTIPLLSLLLSCSKDLQKSHRHRTESENSLFGQNSSDQNAGTGTVLTPGGNDPFLTDATNSENNGAGRVMMEQWDGIPGNDIAALKSSKDFPHRPSSRMFLNRLETPANLGDNHGKRIRGYLHVTKSGGYVFYITGDNQSQFFLSTTEKPDQLSNQPLAGISDAQWTGLAEWEKYPGQTSAEVRLEAGKRYYFEVLNKDGTGNDGVAVGWKMPDGQIERPISGSHLSPFEIHPEYAATIPAAADLFKTLSRTHPRLVGSALDFTHLKRKISTDADYQRFFAVIKGTGSTSAARNPGPRERCDIEASGRKSADQLLTTLPCTRILTEGKPARLLHTSREVLRRVEILAMAYRVTGDQKYADRAILEMTAVADDAWGDWHEKHFLDTAEMTHALALGYDWLYDAMSVSDRDLVVAGIKKKGLAKGKLEYENKTFWTNAHHNWNVVCNSGLALGALAIADVEPEISKDILHKALTSVKESGSFLQYGPDGAYPEGIGYWGYATKYLAAYTSALESALGTDFGLGKAAGLSEAGRFPMAMYAPNSKVFNYADFGNDWRVDPAQEMHFLAQKYGRPEYAAFAKNHASVYGMLWFNPEYANAVLKGSLDQKFRKADIAILRTGTSNDDAYVGVKGGDNKAGHSHLDLGSFVYDAKGVRWAFDLGAEPYEKTTQYFDMKGGRWKYYRTRAEGQNTLVINPSQNPDQDPNASAGIEKFQSSTTEAFAILNLTDAYKPSKTSSVRRGLKLLKDSQSLVIQDEIVASQSSDIWWFMHTDRSTTITVKGSGTTAELKNGNKTLVARILSPSTARFSEPKDAKSLPSSPEIPKWTEEDAPDGVEPGTPQGDSNRGFKKLAIHLEGFSGGTITVLLTPLNNGESQPAIIPTVAELKDW